MKKALAIINPISGTGSKKSLPELLGRAYSDLTAEGFVANVPGKGYFVLPRDAGLVHEQVLREVEGHLGRAVERARVAGLTAEELHAVLDSVIATQEDQ